MRNPDFRERIDLAHSDGHSHVHTGQIHLRADEPPKEQGYPERLWRIKNEHLPAVAAKDIDVERHNILK
jgi:hypothetical protein